MPLPSPSCSGRWYQRPPGSNTEQFGDGQLQRRKELFGQGLFSGKNSFEHQAVLAAVIDLQVVVAWVNHPKTRDVQFLVNLLFRDGVRSMVVGADHFGGEPELARGVRDQRQVR